MPSIFARPNKFRGLSYGSILSCDMGKLVPVYRQDVVPGDEFKVSADTFVRLAPMLAPVFGEINLWLHFFFVPNRTIWDNFEDFVTNGLENGVSTAVHPYITGKSYADETYGALWDIGSLADYLGVPVKDAAGVDGNGDPDGSSVVNANGIKFDALPFRAYAKIWNDWYRNEFLQNEVTFSKADGADTTTNLDLLTRSWKRDFYTSALPFTQLGDPVKLPLGSKAPVVSNGEGIRLTDGTQEMYLSSFDDSSYNGLTALHPNVGIPRNIGDSVDTGYPASTGKVLGISTWKPGLYADLSSATAATVEDVRTAFQLQKIQVRRALSGNRYVEYIASAFGVRSPDARLQRAEFLGGGRAPIMISEVLQTSAGTQTSPQGNMSGHGVGASRTFAFNKAFTEHGWIIGILSVMPKAYYSQGVPQDLMNKETWLNYYQPELAHLGEEAIDKKSVVATASSGVWGFQPRNERMRRRVSEVHGDFRTSLNYWTLAREFSSTDVPLNSEFVSCNPSKRIFAAGEQGDRPIWLEMWFDVKAIRPLPRKGTPGLVDH